VKQDYPAFYERETQFRRAMAYPPFTSLANVIVRDTDLEKSIRWSRQLSEYFSPHDGKGLRILVPPPRRSRIEARTSLPIFAEVAEAFAARQDPWRRHDLPRFKRNSGDRRVSRHGPAEPDVSGAV